MLIFFFVLHFYGTLFWSLPFWFSLNFQLIVSGEDNIKADNNNNNNLKTNILPEWFSTHPAYLFPTKINSVADGFGSIYSNQSQNLGWIIELNFEPGHGIDIFIEELHLGTADDDYLIVAGWPLSTDGFKTIRMFTGTFTNLQKLRILNSKSFFVLFNAKESKVSPKLMITYKRYGKSYIKQTTTTEEPVMENTAVEVYLKGRNPKNYSQDFIIDMKKAIRKMAKAYCLANNIEFNNSLSVNEMIIFHKISFCPFEWPERDVCAIVEHSVFVSGEKSSTNKVKMNYELTSQHLKEMWAASDLHEIQELGVTLFELPKIFRVILLWSVAIGVVVLSSLVIIFIFREIEKRSKGKRETLPNKENFENFTLKKKNHQQISMLNDSNSKYFESPKTLSTTLKDALMDKNQTDSSVHQQQPLKNYFGSILFFNNKAFEDDEDDNEHETSG